MNRAYTAGFPGSFTAALMLCPLGSTTLRVLDQSRQ